MTGGFSKEPNYLQKTIYKKPIYKQKTFVRISLSYSEFNSSSMKQYLVSSVSNVWFNFDFIMQTNLLFLSLMILPLWWHNVLKNNILLHFHVFPAYHKYHHMPPRHHRSCSNDEIKYLIDFLLIYSFFLFNS